ncbi:MAG: fibronectin type III domain-containing protein, partial [Bryobacteraceae bacterium]
MSQRTGRRLKPPLRPEGRATAVRAVWCFSSILLLAGCGYIGSPLPPALDIPQRVSDLRVVEYGDKISAVFTIAPLTTEGLPLKNIRSVGLLAGTAINPWNERAWLAAARRYPVPAAAPGSFTRDIPARDWTGKEIVVAVLATGPKGKTSDLSNLQTISVEPPLAAPADLKIESRREGIALSWRDSGAPHFRIYRASGDAQPEAIGDATQGNYLDGTTMSGTRYRYWVQATAGELRQSETTGPVQVERADVFPPSVPTGLAAEPGTGRIELSWDRNTEPDFQGYNVYRATGN